jgi:RING finger protein 113A
MFDYKPDICKDYKQTGYCGYGDACIFLHDRGDYKFGWEIEKDWEEEQRKKRLGKTDKEKEQVETSKSAISTDCPICSKKFVNPVKSKCGHLFCEECALQYHKEHKKCAVCTLVTDGIFSSASDYLAKLKA